MANTNLAYQDGLDYYSETPNVRRAQFSPEAMRYENLSELGFVDSSVLKCAQPRAEAARIDFATRRRSS